MKEELFADLVESIKQAGRIRQDAKRAARQSVIGAPDVQNIRGSLGLSQEQFALLIGVSPRTVQNWEQERFPKSARQLRSKTQWRAMRRQRPLLRRSRFDLNLHI